jgi:hypothetical protein
VSLLFLRRLCVCACVLWPLRPESACAAANNNNNSMMMMSALLPAPCLNSYKTETETETETETHMLTKTTVTTNNNTPKNTDDYALRDEWDARIENAQRRAFKRRHAAAMMT